MYARIVMLALLRSVALALPVAAVAEQCHSFKIFVQSVDDVLNFMNLDGATRYIHVVFFLNSGSRLASTFVALAANERQHMPTGDLFTAAGSIPSNVGPGDVYLSMASFVSPPNIGATPSGFFSVAVIHNDVVREPRCVKPPAAFPG